MKEVKKIYITHSGVIVLEDENNDWHTVEHFIDVDTGENLIRAFLGKLSHQVKPNTITETKAEYGSVPFNENKYINPTGF